MTRRYQASALSGYFRRTVDALSTRRPGDLDRLDALIGAPIDAATISALHAALLADTPDCGTRLRRLRQLAMLGMIERDLRQLAPVGEIASAATALAELAIREALATAAAEQRDRGLALVDDTGAPQDLLVVGMGKLGGRELNVSSDIDLVFVMREQGPHPEIAERIAQRTNALLSETTADGFVFRVDTRLRPHGDSGPRIVWFTMLEKYFYEQGREWERFAWLKARVVADSALAGPEARAADEAALMQIVTPFVYRRYLDYAAFSALAGLHDLINEEARRHGSRRAASDNAGFDVKLGRGGIREVEFSAQLLQIVRGGQDASLRARATPEAWRLLASRGLVDTATADAVIDAWTLLRRTEHALQYVEDEQTHWLPDAPARRATIAAMLGLDPHVFQDRLQAARTTVQTVFDQLLAPTRAAVRKEAADAARGGNAGEDGAAVAALEATLDEDSLRLVKALRDSRSYRLASEDSRLRIDRLLREAIRWSQGEDRPAPATWLGRLCEFLETTARRPAYLRLLGEHPGAFARLLSIVGRARWAADYLNRHPVVLDELLDGQLLEALDARQWGDGLRRQLAATPDDVERQMDAMREEHHAAVFRLLAQDLDGRLGVEAIGDQLSALADEVLAITIELAWLRVARRHRETPRFAVVAYGKLGGLELGYESDLDLVFLYDDPHEDAQQNYSQLAQRIAAWLSTRTAAGQLFEIDLRLRPNGNAGLLVSSVGAFSGYQRESAWVWEHQALTRARFCAGSADIGAAFDALRDEVLGRPRDRAALADEIRSMRRRMHDGHPNRSELFDLKHDAGGMVDIEFIVQYLVLAHGAAHPALRENKGNIELLRRAAEAGLIDAEDAAAVADAYRGYRRLQHGLRLNGHEYARVEPARVAVQVGRVRALWDALLGAQA
ncbi:MAG: bifunctional [glutamate--ammonia ligase]-adenylyl-L-tyrosine phosphorylase/[glutamate--ammonia-ligase] adenylyltransferase [Lautropia sp.]